MSAKARPRSRARRWLRRLALAGVVCVALVPLAYVTRAYTLHPLLARLLPWAVARVAPLELTLDGIEGDWWTTLTLRGVGLVELGEARTVERLTLSHVTLRGQLARLFRGDLAGLRDVELAGLAGTLDLRSTPGGTFKAPWISLPAVPGITLSGGQLALRTDAGVVELTELTCAGAAEGPRSLSSAVSVDGVHGHARLVLTPLDAGRQVDAQGALVIPSWIELAVTGALDGRGGTLHGARLDLRGAGALDRALVGSGGVAALDPRLRWFEGKGRAEVVLQGQLDALALSGQVSVTEGRVRAEGVPSLDAVALEVALSPTRIEIVEASCTIGAAPVRATAVIDLGGAAPTVSARIFGENVLLARSSEARIRANIELAASGALAAPDISGEIALVGSRLRLDVDLLGALQGAIPRRGGGGARRSKGEGLELPALGPSGARVDIALVTRDPVRVLGNIARGELRADLRLTGDASVPVLTGQVFVDPLEIALPAATVKFESGAVRFSADRPNVAQLELVGEARLAGYDVQADLKGTYEQPEVQLSSSPPLAADQLVLLLVSGRPPAESGQLTAAGESLAVFVAKDLVKSWFDDGGFDDRKSFLNRIEVVTGRDVSKSGVLTLEATYLVRERISGREGGAYAVLERDAFEDYNLGLRFVVRLR